MIIHPDLWWIIMTRIRFLEFVCGQGNVIYSANECDSNDGTKTFPALFVDCPFLTGTSKCEFKYTAPCDVCSPWHAPPGFHTDMQNGIGSMQPGDGCVSCREANWGNSVFKFKAVGIWKVCTGTAMNFEPNSICRNGTPTRRSCRPASNFCV